MIPFKQSPNFHTGRYGGPPTHIVVHAMAGWFKSTTEVVFMHIGGVSAHYCISQKGDILQMVHEDDTAYHVGSQANRFCIGIEHEDGGDAKGGYCMRHNDWVTPMMLDVSVRLAADICKRHNIPVQNIIGHNDPLLRKLGNSHDDPGPFFDMAAYRQAVAKLSAEKSS